jgi:hypothetical protein
MSRRAFTLVVIAILAAIHLPTLAQGRARAQRVQCAGSAGSAPANATPATPPAAGNSTAPVSSQTGDSAPASLLQQGAGASGPGAFHYSPLPKPGAAVPPRRFIICKGVAVTCVRGQIGGSAG